MSGAFTDRGQAVAFAASWAARDQRVAAMQTWRFSRGAPVGASARGTSDHVKVV